MMLTCIEALPHFYAIKTPLDVYICFVIVYLPVMSNGNVMAMESRQWEGEREWQGGHDLPNATKGSELGSHKYPTKEIEENVQSKVQSHSIGTPTGKSERRSVGKPKTPNTKKQHSFLFACLLFRGCSI